MKKKFLLCAILVGIAFMATACVQTATVHFPRAISATPPAAPADFQQVK